MDLGIPSEGSLHIRLGPPFTPFLRVEKETGFRSGWAEAKARRSLRENRRENRSNDNRRKHHVSLGQSLYFSFRSEDSQ